MHILMMMVVFRNDVVGAVLDISVETATKWIVNIILVYITTCAISLRWLNKNWAVKNSKIAVPSVFVAVVVHIPVGAVGLVQRVEARHVVTVAMFVLSLMVAGMVVWYFVLELVFWMSL